MKTKLLLVAIQAGVARAFLFTQRRPAALIGPSNRHRLTSSSNDNNEPVFFDDFGSDFIGESAPSPGGASTTAILQERITQLQETEVRTSARLAKNFRQGNWKVRGFSLSKEDPTAEVGEEEDEDTSSPAIVVTKVAFATDDASAVLVGRSDGSICWVQMGTEYWTKFEAKLTVEEKQSMLSSSPNATAQNGTVLQVKSKLQREEQVGKQQQKMTDALGEEPVAPFEVQHQFVAHKDENITALLSAERPEDGSRIIATGSQNGSLAIWSIPADFDDDDEKSRMRPPRFLEGHDDKIVALLGVPLSEDDDDDNPTLLLSIGQDGSLALWDLFNGDLVFRCRVVLKDGSTPDRNLVRSADTNGQVLFCGLESGHVVSYLVRDLIQFASTGETSNPLPNGQFLAYENAEVTALSSSSNTLNQMERQRAGAPRSFSVLTGASDGAVKQWEVMMRRRPQEASGDNDKGTESITTALEHWPRLSTQRLQRRAHLFPTPTTPTRVTALAMVDPTKILSAQDDGTVRAWSPLTAEELFRMDGFTSIVTSLCLSADKLITDGMDHFVCVHDFNIDGEKEIKDGYELEW